MGVPSTWCGILGPHRRRRESRGPTRNPVQGPCVPFQTLLTWVAGGLPPSLWNQNELLIWTSPPVLRSSLLARLKAHGDCLRTSFLIPRPRIDQKPHGPQVMGHRTQVKVQDAKGPASMPRGQGLNQGVRLQSKDQGSPRVPII